MDEQGLLAARKAVGTIPGAALWIDVEKAIAAYLSASSNSDPLPTATSFQMLMDAYIRGNRWAHENGLGADGVHKAAYDYADKITGDQP